MTGKPVVLRERARRDVSRVLHTARHIPAWLQEPLED